MFFGRFAALTSELILWRIRKLNDILDARRRILSRRATAGIMNPLQAQQTENVLAQTSLLVGVTTVEDKATVQAKLDSAPINYPVELICLHEVQEEVTSITQMLAEQSD